MKLRTKDEMREYQRQRRARQRNATPKAVTPSRTPELERRPEAIANMPPSVKRPKACYKPISARMGDVCLLPDAHGSGELRLLISGRPTGTGLHQVEDCPLPGTILYLDSISGRTSPDCVLLVFWSVLADQPGRDTSTPIGFGKLLTRSTLHRCGAKKRRFLLEDTVCDRII